MIAADLHARATADYAEDAFARAVRIVRLPAGFSTDDAGDAAARLLAEVGATVD